MKKEVRGKIKSERKQELRIIRFCEEERKKKKTRKT